MNPQGVDLLSQLRDIHAAAEAPWWPPAPGWWILAALMLFLLVMAARRGWLAWQSHRRRRRMIGWVEAIEQDIDPATAPQDFLAGINRVFKLVALSAFPDQHCAHLQGDHWARFLRERIGDSADLDQLEVLANGPYRPVPRFDAAAMNRLARQWIRRHG